MSMHAPSRSPKAALLLPTGPALQVAVACLAAAMVSLCFAGCGGSGDVKTGFDPETQAQVDSLLAEWKALLADAEHNLGNDRYGHIMMELAQHGVTDYTPMLGVLEDPQSSEFAKIAASNSIGVVLPFDSDGSMVINRLRELVGPEHDPETRAIVLQLLADGQPQHCADLFRLYQSDPDQRVRLACLSGLVQVGDPEGVRAVVELFRSPDTPAKGRDWAVLTLLDGPPLADVSPLAEAMVSPELPETTRRAAILALGRTGDAAQLEVLRALGRSGRLSPPLEEAVTTAIAVLESSAARDSAELDPSSTAESAGSARD